MSQTEADLGPIARAIEGKAIERQEAEAAMADATEGLRALVVVATAAGMTEVEAARLAGVTRMTVRTWRGK